MTATPEFCDFQHVQGKLWRCSRCGHEARWNGEPGKVACGTAPPPVRPDETPPYLECPHRGSPTGERYDCGCGGKWPVYTCDKHSCETLLRRPVRGKGWAGRDCFTCAVLRGEHV